MTLADVQFSDHGEAVVARMSGEVDLSNAEMLGTAIVETTSNQAHTLVLDLSAVDYLDSAGIQLIYLLREKLRVRGQGLRLVVPAESAAHDALRLAGVLRNVETIETVEEALAEA